jgi:hypothetical protein
MGKSSSPPSEEERATTPVLGGRVRHALTRLVDFGEPRRLQANAARRFKEGRFHDAFRAAKDAISRIEGESRDYVESGMALAIASARRILETSEGTTEWARKVSDHLREVMHAFEAGSFTEAVPLMEKLDSAVSRLYAYEMDRHRNHVAAQGRAIAEIQAMGGETTLPRRKLRRAVLALAQDDRESYLEVVEELDPLVNRAREKRVEEIERAAEEVKGPLKGGLEVALGADDFISGHFLLLASHETAFQEAQEPSTAAFEDHEKVTLLLGVLQQIASVVERAEEQGLDVDPAAGDLAVAQRLAEEGNYAEALVKGRRAYQLLKNLKNQAESEGQSLEYPSLVPKAPRTPDETPVGDENEPEAAGDEALIWCLECGSVQVGLDPDGTLRCLRCDAIVPASFP